MKNSLQRINSGFELAEELINKLEERVIDIMQTEEQRENSGER